jgi:SAM-dependent methyltransferase
MWFAEHSHMPVGTKSNEGGVPEDKYFMTFDPFVAMTAAAVATTTLRVATGVCLLPQRDPIHTAKEVASIDALSNGRVIFGVGAGWRPNGSSTTSLRTSLTELKSIGPLPVRSAPGRLAGLPSIVMMIWNYYATPELAVHYDADCLGRADFPFYLALADRLGAQTVADVGCGTGLLCRELVTTGRSVIGVDPEPTMLGLARSQPSAENVRWINGTAADLPAGWADLVLMTGHVAQYFLDDDAWRGVLDEVRRALVPGGHFAFEIRNDAVEEWRFWSTKEPVPTTAGTVHTEVQRSGDLITHLDHWTQDGRTWTTTETLRFPTWQTTSAGLTGAGFAIVESWGDFDGGPIHIGSPEWIVLSVSRGFGS